MAGEGGGGRIPVLISNEKGGEGGREARTPPIDPPQPNIVITRFIRIIHSNSSCLSNLISLVPEYEITEPYQSNEDGEFVTHTLHERHTRDAHGSSAWHYKMDAFGNKIHLKLTRNTQLIKPGLELETMRENGWVTRTSVKPDSFFHGKEASDPGSLVALSNDKGLVRCPMFFFL